MKRDLLVKKECMDCIITAIFLDMENSRGKHGVLK